MAVHNTVLELIGKTPLICLDRLTARYGCSGRIWAKLEGRNPSGSQYDRTALFTLRAAIQNGELKESGTILLTCGGAPARSYALCAAVLGLRCCLLIPDDSPADLGDVLRRYGAEVVYVPAGDPEALARRAALMEERRPGCWQPSLYNSEAACQAHRETTAPEILEQLPDVTDFVAGCYTGALLTGAGEYLKSRQPELRVICAEPSACPVISGQGRGPSPIPGLGAGFVPDNLNPFILDEVVRVRAEDADRLCQELARGEGILCRPADGAALCAALDLARRKESESHNICVILPSAGY